MTKVTKREAINYVLTSFDVPEQYAEVFRHMIEQMDARNGAERKPSKATLERRAQNASLGEVFKGYIAENDGCTVADILANVPEAEGLSSSKVASVLRSTDGVVRTEVKRKGHYHIG